MKITLDQLYNLKDKVVLITGSNGQIGSQLVETYLEMGCVVIGADKGEFKSTIKPILYLDLDITSKKAVEEAFTQVFLKYKTIDVLINNAGVSTFEPFEERQENTFDWVMDVNLKGTFWCIQEYVNQIDKNKQKKGSIVNIASFYGVISPDFRIYTDCDRKNSEIYGATKAGVIQMTKYFGVHLAERNIRVNSVSPGGIFNPNNPQGAEFVQNYAYRCPMKRMANAEEMMGGVLYLSSDASTYTTGHNLIIDGGMSCW